jgi:EpsI family protein
MSSNKSFIVALLLLIITAALVLIVAKRGVPVIVETNLEKLPLQIAGYQGQEDNFSQEIYDTLDADLHLYRHYHATNGTRLNFYLGYYGTAKGGRTGHNPYACLPGAGWAIMDSGTVEVASQNYPGGVTINFVIASKNGFINVMLHWYQSAGTKILATGLQQNMERFKGRVLYNRNDGAYIQVNSLATIDSIPETKDKLMMFVGELIDFIPAYWPLED